MTRVLIVDDHEENLYYLEALLAGHGYSTDRARHGAEALVKARLNRPDLVISDLLMPIMDGYTLLRHWKSDRDLMAIPFVVHTATYTEPEDEQLALSLGADRFILKPAEPEDLIQQLLQTLNNAQSGAVRSLSAPAVNDEKDLLRNYSQTLIRKLEEKSLRLEEANRALQQELMERQIAERALRVSETHMAIAQKMAHFGSWELELANTDDIDANSLRWSDEMYRIAGYDPGSVEVSNELFFSLVPIEERAPIREAVRVAMRDGTPYMFEHRLIRPSGEVRFVQETAQFFFDEQRNPIKLVGTAQDVTESKQVEADRRRSAALLQSVADGTPDAVFVKDRSGRYLLFNAAAARLVGKPVSEVLGQDDNALFVPVDARKLMESDRRVMESGIADHSEEILTAGGVTRTYDVTKAPYFDEAGKVIGLIGISRDVSARKLVEQAQREQALLFAYAQRIGRMGRWSLDVESGRLVWSDETCELFGLKPEEFTGAIEQFYSLVLPDDLPILRSAATRLTPAQPTIEIEYRIRRPDNQVRWMYQRGGAQLDPSDGRLRHLGMVMDVSEQKQAVEMIRESEGRFQLLSKATNDAIWDWNLRTNMVWWNEGFETLFGFRRDQVESSLDSWTSRLHPEDRERVVGDISRFIGCAENEIWTGSYRFARQDGSFADVWDRGHVIRSEQGEALRMVGGMMDITERRKAEAALQQSLIELDNRNRDLQEFAFAASHDLQEPLRKIRMFSDVLVNRHRSELSVQAQGYLDRVSQASARMQVLIDDLLAYSRVASVAKPFATVDLEKICREVLIDLDSRIESSQARIEVQKLPSIQADATQMRQLFQNLLANALKFHFPERIPVISVSSEQVQLNATPAWRIDFIDNGIGFDVKFAERIFNPFLRLHARTEYEGTGMGLAIVRRIVERHGGTVEATGEVGKGAHFSVVLPCAPVGHQT